jgi:glycosyltransferase involved in cell wall biosynthesis
MVKDYWVSDRTNDDPIRILYIVSGDLWAGAAVQVYHTLSALHRGPGFYVMCVLFSDGTLKTNLEKLNIRTVLLDETKLNSVTTLLRLKQVIQTEKPHLIHVHAVKEHLFEKVSAILANKKIPVVRTVHGYTSVPEGLALGKYVRSRLVVALDKFLIKHLAEAVIAVSKDMEKRFVAQRVRGKVRQTYNAINTNEVNTNDESNSARRKYDIGDNFWIGTAARLVRVKNQRMLIEAGRCLFAKGIPFKISIFGNGPLKEDLGRLVEKYGLGDKIFLHGFEPDIHPVLNALDVFVLCSSNEGLPMALLEAMYMRTPVVCTAVGGMKEIIEGGVNGMLVPSGDSSGLANCLVKLYENQEMARKLATNARATIEEKFSLDKTLGNLCRVYDEVLTQQEK